MVSEEKAFNGKILNVDLSTGSTQAEAIPPDLYRKYLGGYGLGARLLFNRIPKGADPLGPENILGLMPGLLTGTPFFGSRYQAVTKSPKTGGWGDANGGGDFGPVLKNAGWDGVLLSGISAKPVYLLLSDDKAEILDAADLWGMDSIAAEEKLKERHGKKASVACIGPAGEKLSLMAIINNDHGRPAARSAVGAVMGSKNVKAVVAVASRGAILSQDKDVQAEVKKALGGINAIVQDQLHTFGTTGLTNISATSGDAPIKNWGGAIDDFYEAAEMSGIAIGSNRDKFYGCWHCPVACGAEGKASDNPKFPFPLHTHRPEYETTTAFGALMLNNDLDSLHYANHLCNAYGVDTIAAGATLSFAIECYENGLITKEDTDGIELRWGNIEGALAMLEKMAKREGFGDILADGIRKAVEHIGPASKPFAMEIGGEELPMHDPKLMPDYFTTYKLDATPARHTQWDMSGLSRWNLGRRVMDRETFTGRAEFHKGASEYMHVINAAGLCFIAMVCAPNDQIDGWINAVTGWDTTMEELRTVGERIANLRMAFEIREGNNPAKRDVPGRLIGDPPLIGGAHAGFALDAETLQREFLTACDWDQETTKPSRAKLEELGLADVAEVLHG